MCVCVCLQVSFAYTTGDGARRKPSCHRVMTEAKKAFVLPYCIGKDYLVCMHILYHCRIVLIQIRSPVLYRTSRPAHSGSEHNSGAVGKQKKNLQS